MIDDERVGLPSERFAVLAQNFTGTNSYYIKLVLPRRPVLELVPANPSLNSARRKIVWRTTTTIIFWPISQKFTAYWLRFYRQLSIRSNSIRSGRSAWNCRYKRSGLKFQSDRTVQVDPVFQAAWLESSGSRWAFSWYFADENGIGSDWNGR